MWTKNWNYKPQDCQMITWPFYEIWINNKKKTTKKYSLKGYIQPKKSSKNIPETNIFLKKLYDSYIVKKMRKIKLTKAAKLMINRRNLQISQQHLDILVLFRFWFILFSKNRIFILLSLTIYHVLDNYFFPAGGI